ncbi:MAG: beta-ketoacyl synthase [Gammaproteobacteria bacterium]|nr:beta-ketoacyl synthase [Gammaproteobacteria bacterium]
MAERTAWIVALGASTPLGRCAWSSAAAVRGGITGFGEHPYMTDAVGEPMRVARAPWLDIELVGTARLEALLVPAIDQVLAVLTAERTDTLRAGIALAVPAPRPGLADEVAQALIDSVTSRYRGWFADIDVSPVGHAAGLLALDRACDGLDRNLFDLCVVAGVDSYIEAETLEWLEQENQLHGAGQLNNAWGFIPGEGAGALLLMRADVAQALGLEPLLQVRGVGIADEPNRIKTGAVCIGEGLTDALRSALDGLPAGEQVSDVYCDMNGEPYRADEYGFACLRTKEAFASLSDFNAPADCWGDVGAASAPLHIGLAAIARHKDYAHGGAALVWASSEGGERGAALMLGGKR